MFLFHAHLKPRFNANVYLLPVHFFTGSCTHGIENRSPWILGSCRKSGMVSFCRAPLDVHGQLVVGKLEGGEPSAGNGFFSDALWIPQSCLFVAGWDFMFALWVLFPATPLSRFQPLHLSCMWLQLH